jgi:hypothetical protein
MKKPFPLRLDDDIHRMLTVGSQATHLEMSELVRQGLLAGVPRVVEGLLGARTATETERRRRMQSHVRKYAGSWKGMRGKALLARTRP